MVHVAIFDVDGTIVDSVDLHARAWQEAFKHFGKEVPFEAVRRQIGKGGDQLMPVFLSPRELEKFSKELDRYRSELFKKNYLPQVRPWPKVRELFTVIKAAGKRIALGSSAKADELAIYKKIAKIEDLVDVETSSKDAEQSKPHADIFEATLDRLNGMKPDATIVVGDTPYDAEAAAKAGLATIGLTCGGWHEEELRRVGCIAVYRDAADLLEHYPESPLK